MRKFFPHILLIVISLGLGFLIGKMVTIPGIEMDLKINPLHGISILSTVFVAVLISMFFEKEKEKNRITNELIIKRLDSVLPLIDDLHDSISGGNMPYVKATSSKRIHSALKFTWNVMNEKELNFNTEFTEVESEYRNLKDLLTNVPADTTDDNSPLKVKDGMATYQPSRISEIERSLELLKNIIFKTQLDLL